MKASIPLFISVLPLAWGCRESGGDEDFGLTQRQRVEGVTFPTGLPQPTALGVVRRFPNLSFAQPLFLTPAPDGTPRLFVVEKTGRVRVFADDDAVTRSTIFLDIMDRVGPAGEGGLLGLAFHPDYSQNGFFYVYYTTTGQLRSRVSRFQVTADPDLADPASESILLEFPQPYSNHNAGMIAFGSDGRLYIATGDGGSANDPHGNAQNLGTLLGKLLRITPSGGIPADNPFVDDPAARGEIWAYGLRNPWRFSFDRQTGELWLGDVGQADIEEIDIIVKGGNYGWRIYEGNRSNINPGGQPPSAFEGPVSSYDHSLGRSITGGYVYRGSLLPSHVGAYFYADYASGRIWALVYDGNRVVSNTQVATLNTPASFAEDRDGELYVCSFDGGIYQFEESGGEAPQVPALLSETGLFINTANLVPIAGLIEYEVNSPRWSDGARTRQWLAPPGLTVINFDATEAWEFPVGTVIAQQVDLDLAPGVVRRLETRVLVQQATGLTGYTYKWNEAQTDADLQADASTETFTIQDPLAPGGERQQEWQFPGPADCIQCHSGRVLGIRTRQLNRDFPYRNLTDNQLRSWNHIGLFDRNIGSHDNYGAFADPRDTTEPVAARARSYMATNCAVCHFPAGPTPTDIDLRFDTPVDDINAVDVAPTGGDLGLTGAMRISTGLKESSVLWERLRRLESVRMPPLGSNRVDQAAVDVIGQWIDEGPE